jgi:hypothetical protein
MSSRDDPIDPNTDHNYHGKDDISKIISMLEEMVIKTGWDASIGPGSGDGSFGDIRIPAKLVPEFVEFLRSSQNPPAPDTKYYFDAGWKKGYEQGKSEAVTEILAPLRAVYKKFDHLDKCLSDPEWCSSGESAAIYGIAGELWRAIKVSLEVKRP